MDGGGGLLIISLLLIKICKCYYLIKEIPDRDDNVYDQFNAPKWRQDCMLSVELR